MLAGGLAIAAFLATPAAAKPANEDPGGKSCLQPKSWVAGTTAICKGAVVYSDYVYDDYGAESGGIFNDRVGPLSPGAGDAEYPEGSESTADLVRLNLRPSGADRNQLRVKGLLSALYEKDSTVLAIAVDTDGDPATGGGEWNELGVSSKGWDQLYTFDRGLPGKNVIRGRIPMPESRRFGLQAVTAIAGSNQVMNVAFRGPDEVPGFGVDALSDPSGGGAWYEDLQAAALAGGDISQFGETINRRDLVKRKTRIPVIESGLHERVYTSRYTLPPGEGVSYEGIPGRGDGGGEIQGGFLAQAFNFPGVYQPYSIYLPEQPGPHGMQMVFHGSSANHASQVAQPGMQQRFGEELNRILVNPEGRGTEGWGSDISERDILDVMADVRRNYEIDKSEVIASGYSQGGYVTYRTAGLYPDIFAGAVNWVGFTGDVFNGIPGSPFTATAGAVGNGPDFIPNLLNVPSIMLYGGADELVQITTAMAMNRAFQQTDNIYRFDTYPAAEHLTFIALDDWREESAYSKDLTLVENPPRVLYRTAPFLDSPAYGIRHDSAYWVSKLRTSGGAKDYGQVDLTNAGCGGTLPVLERRAGGGALPLPYLSDEQRVVSEQPLNREPRLSGALDGVASLAIDAKQTCLTGKAIDYEIETDEPSTISFSDGRRLTLPDAGMHEGTLRK